ncbi:MAG: hypothetical protein HN576_11955 [Bacteriovoracaceae bacterium]|jgi:hypothetical protein|nr:hypothetical protein [Bacteriovoracaceae bacterium]
MSTQIFLKSIVRIIAEISEEYFIEGPSSIRDKPYVEKNVVIHDSNVSNILICNQDIRIIFKIHYDHKQANKLLKDTLHLDYSNVQVDDYYLEACNLIAGKIKIFFTNKDMDVGISIPLKTAGFDELFFPVYNDQYRIEYTWTLQTGQETVIMSAFIELIDPKLQKVMKDIDIKDIKTDEDVEFF